MTRGYTIPSVDGGFVKIEETEEKDQVVLSIFRPEAAQSVRLDKKGLGDLKDSYYRLDIKGDTDDTE